MRPDYFVKSWRETGLPYVRIPRLVILDKMLQTGDAEVLAHIVKYDMENKGVSWPSMKSLMEDLGLSKPTIINAIKRLEKAGWLVKTRNYTKANTYQEATPVFSKLEDFVDRFRLDFFPISEKDLVLEAPFQTEEEIQRFKSFIQHLAELRKKSRKKKDLAAKALESVQHDEGFDDRCSTWVGEDV